MTVVGATARSRVPDLLAPAAPSGRGQPSHVILPRVEEVRTAEHLGALEKEWNALAKAIGDGVPFRTWEWADAWWRWFHERRFAVRDRLAMRLFRSPAGELVGVAPLILVHRPGVGPPLIRSLEFLGADPYVTEVRGVLAHPAWEARVYRALCADLRRRWERWDWMTWHGVPAGGEVQQLMGGWGVSLPHELPAYVLPLTAPWEEFRSSRPRNLKESLRKCYNSLARDGHAFELRVARTPAAVAEALERFLVLHGARASARGLKAHANVFGDAASRCFLLDVCGRLARRDAVRVFQLRIGGEVVATRIGFAMGRTLYLYFSGYDPAWARYSVMTTTVAEAIRYAISEGFEAVHLSTGTDESKLRWRPEVRASLSGREYASGPWGAAARWASRIIESTPKDGLVRAVLGRRRAV